MASTEAMDAVTGPRLRVLDDGWLAAVVAVERAGQANPWSSRLLAEALAAPAATVWGALDGERLLGFAVVYRLPFEAELQAITVAPGARRRGVARRLVEGLLAAARDDGSERLLLEVRADNAPALALYQRLGFAEEGRRRGYYPPAPGASQREDALLMSRRLNDGS